MEDFKHYVKDGDSYILKNQTILHTILGIIVILFGFFIYRYGTGENRTLINGLALLCVGFGLFIVYRLSARIVFNKKDRTISVQSGAKFPVTVYSFDDFERFSVVHTNYSFIRVNAALHMLLKKKGGGTKTLKMRQYIIVAGPIDRAIEETAFIMDLPEEAIRKAEEE